jgi:hypothetical protein
VRTESTTQVSESGVQKSSESWKKWHVVFRDLELEAEPGTVYLVTKAHDRYVMQVLPLDVTRGGEGPDLREIVQNVLAVSGPDYR